jgi:hypothetical protein
MNKVHLYLAAVFASLVLVANSQAQLILIEEAFGGSGAANLSTDTADTFSSAITTAGGSSSWNADPLFKANGSTSGSSSDDFAAFLNLGTYIDDAKGTAAGLFTFEATFTTPTDSGSWISFGLFNGDQVTSTNFAQGSDGLTTSIIRDASVDEVDYFAGIGTANSPASGPAFTGSSVTFTTVLDLRTYDGSTDFGSVRFYTDGGTSADFTYAYTLADSPSLTFQQIGFSVNNGANSTISDFSLTQIPEPSTFTLLAFGAGALLLLRRTRQTHQS